MKKEEFLRRANNAHNGKYRYIDLKDEFSVNYTKITVICPIHGKFTQNARCHYRGQGCKECSKEKMIHSSNTEEFKEKAIRKYGDKYDLSKIEYNGCEKDIIVGCKIHGDFRTTPHNFLKGVTLCKECIRNERIERAKNLRLSQEDFISKLKDVHGDKYGTDKAIYVNNSTLITLYCQKHGYFNIRPVKLFLGQGCNRCKESKLEKKISLLLQENNIIFEYQKHFPWLGIQSLDFYLPKYNIAIECQGIQHFESSIHFGGDEAFKRRQELDKRKNKLCKEHGVKLLYYTSEYEIKNFLNEKIYSDSNKLLKKIMENETADKEECCESK